jgi:membrane-associated protease RseP (regulator of RpoE activity)
MRRLSLCLAATVAIFAACSTSALADPPGGWVGIEWGAPAAMAKGTLRGFRVHRVIEGSPAAEAGLLKNDVIVAMDGQSFTTMQGMGDATYAKGPGTSVKYDVMRGDAERVVTVKLAPYELARSIFEKQAATGDVSAMFQLGYLLMMGRGLPQDYVESRRWLMMAADRGLGGAMHLLGDMTKLGLGGKVDFEAADRWYQRAAVARRRESLGDFPRANPLSPPQETAWPRGLAEALGEQIRACWKPTKGWPVVTVRFKLAQDGLLSGAPELPLHKAEAEVAETAAVGAITKCQPFRLPADQYEAWKSVVWTFDPAVFYSSE